MYKSGVDMLKSVLRVRSLWKSDSLIHKNTLHCRIRSVASSSHWHRQTTQGRSFERVRYYSQPSEHGDFLNVQVKQTTKLQPTDPADLPPEKTAPFYTQLLDCSSPTDVLDTSHQFPESQRHISSTLTRMWDTMKRLSDEQRRCELRLMFDHPGFEELCDRAATDAWRMKNDDLVYSLLAMIKLGLSQNTRVVQTLLRVIQERLNQFDERSLSVLAGSLRDMEDSKNIQGLRDALRLLLKDRISDIQSVVVLQSMMRAVGRDSPIQLKKQLAMKALSMTDKFSPPNNQYMFCSLAAMGLNFKPLLDVCSLKIAENVHEFPFNRLLVVLKSCHELRYRNYSLFSAVSEPAALLDAFAERILQNSDSLTLRDLLSILKVFSLFNHDLKDNRQEFLISVTRGLETYLSKISNIDLLKAVHYLAFLKHFPQAPLEKLFEQDTLDMLLEKGRKAGKVQNWLHALDLCLRLDKSHLPSSLTSIPNLKVLTQEISVNQEVLSAVRSIVGNDAVQEGVLEQGVYFIDCVITPSGQTQGNCEPHNDDSKYLEVAERTAVVCAPLHSFCFGSTHPRGHLSVKLRHLKKLGYKPVLVPVHELRSKTEEERIKMLQKLIFPQESTEGQTGGVLQRFSFRRRPVRFYLSILRFANSSSNKSKSF
ncbi:FAST kinase domain-containing protein 2, mitochondrial [Triplophysa tibetana]|uniref:FAST kinase domain-containing protein 2, mitochondrial n=1 Tax=Triplophysa tibetana TaxID=1572043 RepID=A0A5A9PNT6_9TELE|nr:FAST kinase domain-containing protein 2, mitochondrial [Triplophysa tibetana]